MKNSSPWSQKKIRKMIFFWGGATLSHTNSSWIMWSEIALIKSTLRNICKIVTVASKGFCWPILTSKIYQPCCYLKPFWFFQMWLNFCYTSNFKTPSNKHHYFREFTDCSVLLRNQRIYLGYNLCRWFL